jgi:hypothetical protein
VETTGCQLSNHNHVPRQARGKRNGKLKADASRWDSHRSWIRRGVPGAAVACEGLRSAKGAAIMQGLPMSRRASVLPAVRISDIIVVRVARSCSSPAVRSAACPPAAIIAVAVSAVSLVATSVVVTDRRASLHPKKKTKHTGKRSTPCQQHDDLNQREQYEAASTSRARGPSSRGRSRGRGRSRSSSSSSSSRAGTAVVRPLSASSCSS